MARCLKLSTPVDWTAGVAGPMAMVSGKGIVVGEETSPIGPSGGASGSVAVPGVGATGEDSAEVSDGPMGDGISERLLT